MSARKAPAPALRLAHPAPAQPTRPVVRSRLPAGGEAPTRWHVVRWVAADEAAVQRYVFGASSTQEAAREALLTTFGADRPPLAPERVEVRTMGPGGPVGAVDALVVDEWEALLTFRREGRTDLYLNASRAFNHLIKARNHLLVARPIDVNAIPGEADVALRRLDGVVDFVAQLVGELESKGGKL